MLQLEWDENEATKAILGLGEIAGREVQISALKTTVQPVVEAMRSRFESDHPRGRRTARDIHAAESAESKGGGDPELLIGGSRRKGGRAFVMRFIEFGTSKMGAVPFMRPTYDSAKPHLVADYIKALQPAYRRILKKYGGGA